MSDEAQRMLMRVLLWALFIIVVVSLVGVAYYFLEIKPGMRPQTVAAPQTPTAASAQQQAVEQTLESTSTVTPQTLETNQQTVEQSLQNSPPPSQQSAQTNQQGVENALNGN